MKLQATLSFLVLLLSNIVTGQINYGVKAGITLSDQYKKINPPGYPAENLETKILPGFEAGVFLKHHLNDKLSLAAELNYSLIGSKTKYTRTDFIVNPDGSISGPTTGYYNDKIQRIEIPLFLQYNLDKFYLALGPAIGIKLSSKISHYQNSSFKSAYYRPLDLGAGAIMGYPVCKKMDLTLKYNFGFTDADNRDYSIIKNRVLTFSVLYSLK
ncbi:MAG: porin family protein [Bacteroidota bacterium]|nr:porin family protein [Bacteroidota bacterium]